MLRATNTTQPNPRNWKQNILKRNHMLPPWRPCSRSSLPTSTRPSPPSCSCLSSSPSFSFSPLLFSIVIELTFYRGCFHKHIWWWCLLYPLKKASPHSQHHNHHLQYTNEVTSPSLSRSASSSPTPSCHWCCCHPHPRPHCQNVGVGSWLWLGCSSHSLCATKDCSKVSHLWLFLSRQDWSENIWCQYIWTPKDIDPRCERLTTTGVISQPNAPPFDPPPYTERWYLSDSDGKWGMWWWSTSNQNTYYPVAKDHLHSADRTEPENSFA